MNPFILLFAVAGILLVLQRIYKQRGLRGVAYRFDVSRGLVAPDEPFELRTTLVNHTRLFIPYVMAREQIPEGMKTDGGYMPETNDREPRLLLKTYLFPRSEFSRRVPVRMPARGRYAFTAAWLHGGDFMGMSDDMRILPRSAEIVVYPTPAEDVHLHAAMDNFLGNVSVRRFIMEDPVLTVGFREYTGREPLKAISWLHSARMGQPMVRIHDYTAEMSVSVVLDIDGKDGEEPFERCLSLGHTVCRFLEQKKISYDFFSNLTTLGAVYSNWQYIAKGLGTAHFNKILEGLGRAANTAKEPLDAVLERVWKKGSPKGLIIISNGEKARVRQLVRQYKIESPMLLFGGGV